VQRVLDDAAEQAAALWRSWCEGADAQQFAVGESAGPQRGHSGAFIGDVGAEDAEHPRSASQAGSLHVQQQLCRLTDKCIAHGLVNQYTTQERWADLHRLSDLSDKEASHDWLWAVDPHKGKPLEADDYVEAVRLRLGCGGPEEAGVCGNCGAAAISCNGEHGLLCARGESTKGHNRVRDELHSMAKSFDAGAETEPEGLIPSHPRLRPADLLTGAFHNGRLAAVDVGVICPSAAGAGLDCVATMEHRKRERLAPFEAELHAGGSEYHPFAISCWGRLHPAAEQMLQHLAKRMARRDGSSSHRSILIRLRARITTEIMRRAARMVLVCLPQIASGEDPGLDHSDEAPPGVDADLRAGHPGLCRLPPLYPAPPCSAAPRD